MSTLAAILAGLVEAIPGAVKLFGVAKAAVRKVRASIAPKPAEPAYHGGTDYLRGKTEEQRSQQAGQHSEEMMNEMRARAIERVLKDKSS